MTSGVRETEAGEPPLPERARPPQVLQAVGVVLVVSAAAAAAAAIGGAPIRVLVLVAAVVAAGFSVRAARGGLRTAEETLAACAVGLAVVGSDTGEGLLASPSWPAAALVVAFAVLAVVCRSVLTWPLAAWFAGQLAVLRALDVLPAQLRTEVLLGVALAGLGLALSARRPVARAALVTTVPWWVAGVALGSAEAWQGTTAERWIAAALMTGAAGGLLLTRRRDDLHPLLGPRLGLPLLAGVVAGAGLTGAADGTGVAAVAVAGFLGVVVASWADASLHGDRRDTWLPVARSLGYTVGLLALGRLLAGQEWDELSALLLLIALPAAIAAWRSTDDRPLLVPVTVVYVAAGVLSAVPAQWWPPSVAAALLTAVYAAALAVGAAFPADVRRGTTLTAALCSLATVALLVVDDQRPLLAVLLAAQSAATLSWAWRTSPATAPADDEADEQAAVATVAWRIGAAQLVLAAWIGVAHAGWTAVEAWTVPLATGLVVAAGRRLVEGPSWRAWGPALLVLFVPTTAIAVVEPHAVRAVVVLLLAGPAMVLGAWRSRRAPLLVGASAALAVALGLAARALPWPIGVALVVGGLLLWWGAVRERDPVGGFGRRLADLR
ncbi:SCO7613 C-terminal domain-containing membrane protein [Blastococcus sp. TF02A-30]|uniref:SCO7613 C-terminal domain-containing membrane protein n=1 Tax=Blastococcus sp. TF02A-30 TaxID=2250580 RepID=UPI000E019573|nr:hypothetical protein [Blastococcus sp. TF02A-30]RBY91337.1 hypothetical protein DQ241_06750 [Blastococcus sp. TF02A-30]